MIRLPLAALTLALAAPLAQAQDGALDGIDPVAYSAESAAVPGRADLVTLWRGKAWHFASEQNRTTFEANPKAYAPGLDGLCAVALSEGILEEGEPAVKRYKEFLSMGGSAYPLDELRHAGVDLATPAPVDAALEKFERILDDAEATLAKLQ